jgi:neurobeachin-like protein 1/2
MGQLAASVQRHPWQGCGFGYPSFRYANDSSSLTFTLNHLFKFSDIVTCVALDNCGSYLVTGSKDCTCIIWSINNFNPTLTAQNNSFNNHSHLTHSPSISSSSTQSQVMVSTHNSLMPKHIHTLYGHDNAVSCVAIMTELDLVVSGSLVS